MNFKGHVTGGIITGSLLAACAWSLNPAANWLPAQIFFTTIFFSLFPDLDISSIPQRWFYRGLFIGLLVLNYKNQYKLATFISIVSITPLMSHHRGWTHSLWAPFTVPLALILGFTQIQKNSDLLKIHWVAVEHTIIQYHWFLISAALGWLTHLLLDSRLKIFKNASDHL